MSKSRMVRMPGRTACLTVCLMVLLPFFWGCDMARMKDDDAFQTYQHRMPEMPKHSIPTEGGLEVLSKTDRSKLVNPLPMNNETIELGKKGYVYYCIQCHGPKLNGYGTVGQSFAPLPTDLASPAVQRQSDGELYYKINLGWKRHPALAYTISPEFTWAIVNYTRSFAKKQGGD